MGSLLLTQRGLCSQFVHTNHRTWAIFVSAHDRSVCATRDCVETQACVVDGSCCDRLMSSVRGSRGVGVLCYEIHLKVYILVAKRLFHSFLKTK